MEQIYFLLFYYVVVNLSRAKLYTNFFICLLGGNCGTSSSAFSYSIASDALILII